MSDFADGKDEGALRTIGEVSDALGIKQHVLRYWEQQFPTLKPLKRSGGRRYYRPADVELVETINHLVNDQGYTLKGAKSAIREGKRASTAAHVSSKASTSSADDAKIPDWLPQLKAIRSRLEAALDA